MVFTITAPEHILFAITAICLLVTLVFVVPRLE